jgi:hypothetical protein
MIKIDENKLDRYYQEYLNNIAENPAASINMKYLAPENWYSTKLLSCVFAHILESNFHDLATLEEVKFQTIENENENKSNL